MDLTIEQLEKLKKLIQENADDLIKYGKVYLSSYYPNDVNLSHYKWVHLSLSNIGKVDLYFTSRSNTIRINGTFIDHEKVSQVKFIDLYNDLLKRVEEKEIKNVGNFLDNL